MRSGFALFVLIFLLLACDRKSAESNVSGNDSLSALDMNTWVKADLECEEVRGADENDPQAVIYLNQMGSSHLIDTTYTCSVIAPEMYRTYDIPRHALSACGGWWLGTGNFYYTLQEGDSIAVMHAMREQQDSLGFQYSVKNRFPVTFPAE